MEEENKAGYGKRPLWQWVLIYLVVGAILYGVIYYFVNASRGYGSSRTTQPNVQQNQTGY